MRIIEVLTVGSRPGIADYSAPTSAAIGRDDPAHSRDNRDVTDETPRRDPARGLARYSIAIAAYIAAPTPSRPRRASCGSSGTRGRAPDARPGGHTPRNDIAPGRCCSTYEKSSAPMTGAGIWPGLVRTEQLGRDARPRTSALSSWLMVTGIARVHGQLGAHAVRARDAFDELPHRVDRERPAVLGDGPERAQHVDRLRDHVVGRAGADLRDRHDDRVERVDAAGRPSPAAPARSPPRSASGSFARYGVDAWPPLPVTLISSTSADAIERTAARPDRARRQVRRHVQRERGVDRIVAVEHALVDHVPRAVVPFLAGLEHEAHGARQLAAPRVQQPRRADEHRGVRVVTARVHAAVDLAREVEPGVLGHRQRVHVAAQQHDRTVADFEIGDDRRHRRARCGRRDRGRRSRRAPSPGSSAARGRARGRDGCGAAARPAREACAGRPRGVPRTRSEVTPEP